MQLRVDQAGTGLIIRAGRSHKAPHLLGSHGTLSISCAGKKRPIPSTADPAAAVEPVTPPVFGSSEHSGGVWSCTVLVQGPVSAASFPASPSRTLIYLLLLNRENTTGMYKHRDRLLLCSASAEGRGKRFLWPVHPFQLEDKQKKQIHPNCLVARTTKHTKAEQSSSYCLGSPSPWQRRGEPR